MKFVYLLALFSLAALVFAQGQDESASLSDFFSPADVASVESSLISDGSAQEIFQSAWAASLLKSSKINKNTACAAAAKHLAAAVAKNPVDLATAGNALRASSLLACSAKDSDVDAAVSAAKEALSSSTPAGLFNAAAVLAGSKKNIDSSDLSNVFQSIVDLQKEDGVFGGEDDEEGTLEQSGEALQALKLIAGLFKPSAQDWETLSQVADKANNLVDKLMENIDDAATVSVAQIFDGLHFLAGTSAGEKVSIDRDNVALIAENLLAVKSSPAASEVGYVVSAFHLLADNKFNVPPVVSVLTKTISGAAKGQDAHVRVRVSDILGHSLGGVSVHLNSASLGDNAVASNVALEAVKGSETEFSFNLLQNKIEHGTYSLDIKINAGKGKRGVADLDKIKRTVRVTAAGAISSFEVSIQDAKTGEGKTTQLDFPKTFSALAADYLQAIEFSFVVRSSVANKVIHPHQAFVRFSHVESGAESIFVTRVVDKKQKVKIVVADAEVFKNRGGEYNVEVIVGDVHLDEAIVWKVGKIALTFAEDAAPEKSGPKPELHHTFRQPDKRPNGLIAIVFAGIIIAAAVLLLGFVGADKIPLGEFNGGVLMYLGVVAAIGALYVFFWLGGTIFECLALVVPLTLVLLFLGPRVFGF